MNIAKIHISILLLITETIRACEKNAPKLGLQWDQVPLLLKEEGKSAVSAKFRNSQR